MATATPEDNEPDELSTGGADEQVELRLTVLQVREALDALSGADWERAKILARFRARGLVDTKPEDLLHETVVALMTSRTWPANVPPLRVLSTAMRSVASNARAHEAASPIRNDLDLEDLERMNAAAKRELGLDGRVPSPEDELSAKQHLEKIYEAVSQDEEVELLLILWTDGVRGKAAQKELGWDDKTFDRVRNRLTRVLKNLQY
jgi:hypothetical protein